MGVATDTATGAAAGAAGREAATAAALGAVMEGRGVRSAVLYSVAGAVLSSQMLLHVIFAHSGGVVHTVDRTHHHAAAATDGPAVVVSVLPSAAHHDGGMLAAHAVAAVATYLLLRHGEVAFFRLLYSLSLCVLRILRAVRRPVTVAVPRRTSWTSPRALADQLLLSSVCGYRGPPALV